MLTKSEREVMELLWSSKEALSCSSIIKYAPNKKWRDSYVHSMMKSLLKKDMVTVDGFEVTSRTYARKFVPKKSKIEYFFTVVINELPADDVLLNIIESAIEKLEDDNSLQVVQNYINSKASV